MKKRKPDFLALLVIVIGLGVVVTGYALDMSGSSGAQVYQVRR